MIPFAVALLLTADTAPEARFENKVRPILVEHCQKCHGPQKQNGGLRLDRKEGPAKGGDSGAAVVPGKPDASLLIRAIRRHPDVSPMPPSKPLPPEAVRALEDWVRDGAPWPDPAPHGALGDVAA